MVETAARTASWELSAVWNVMEDGKLPELSWRRSLRELSSQNMHSIGVFGPIPRAIAKELESILPSVSISQNSSGTTPARVTPIGGQDGEIVGD